MDKDDIFQAHKAGGKGKVIFVLAIAVSLLHVYFNIIKVLPSLWQNSLHYSGFALLCCLTYPLGGPDRKRKWLLAIDLFLGISAATSAIYLISMEDAIYARGVHLSSTEWAAGIILILSALEFTRRTTGWVIPLLIVTALTYVGWWGGLLDNVFKFTGLSTETLLFRSVYGDDGLFGNIALISSSFVFMFILFGAFLLRSGAGDFVVNLARAVAGKTVGGPGLVAVFASGLTGTISGSAVANTASTGVITIPLMKKAGFDPKFAAGVEAAASTGGQLMPPIMGAGAFVMASYTQIPYTTIITASILPAILYFASVAFYVRTEAKKSKVTMLDDEEVKLVDVLKEGGLPFLLPIGALIGMLIAGFTPTYAAGISILAVIASSWLTPNRMGINAIMEALALGARNMIMTGILLCSVGLMVNVIATTGIGNTFSLMITEWSSGSLIIAIVLIGLASLVLGMGLPVTAAYIVLGTLSAPALYNLIVDSQITEIIAKGLLSEEAKTVFLLALPEKAALLGQAMPLEQARALLDAVPLELAGTIRDMAISPHAATFALLSAHMIIFWLSQDSNVTPPVCLAAFTAAAIAKTPPMRTGLYSWKLAKGLYIVPILFAYTPMLGGSWTGDFIIFFFAFIGLYAFAGGFQGYLENRLRLFPRILSLVLAFFLIAPWPNLVHTGAAVIFAALFIFNLRQQPKADNRVHVPYGNDRLTVELPAQTRYLRLQEPPKLITPGLFQKRLVEFLDTTPLDLTRPVLVLADKTRLCGYPEYLPLLLGGLEQHGMDPAHLKIVIGYGTHARQSDTECRQAYGETYDRYSFLHHDCRQENGFKELGRTRRGTPVRIRRDLCEASAIITMGAVSHHYFAGYGGGRKLIFPGCGERDAIYRNHGLYLDGSAGTIAGTCQPGVLAGNPLAEDLFEIEEKLPADLAIHGILNSHGVLCDLLLGHGRENFLEACRRHAENCEVGSSRYGIVIASCGGYPKDINFIQSHKAVHNAAMFVRDGGLLLLYGQCRDGIGSETFLPWFQMASFKAAFTELAGSYQGNGGTALAMMTKLRRIKIGMVTDLDEASCRLIGMERWSHEGVAEYLRSRQPAETVAYIANASLTVKKTGTAPAE